MVEPRSAGLLGLLGMPVDRRLDARLFSSLAAPWRDVLVAGRWVLQSGRPDQAEVIAHRFEAVMAELWPPIASSP